MGHHCDYFGRLKTTGKNIYIEIEAIWKNKRATVYREYLNGKAECRYIYLNWCSGYSVTFPNERLNYYYGYRTQQPKQRFSSCQPFELFTAWNSREQDIKNLLEKRPELKYFIKKENIPNIHYFIRLLARYIEHPEIEALLELRLNRMALDKRLYKLTPEKKKAVIKEINQHKNAIHDELSLSTVLSWVKYGFGNKKPISRDKYQGLTSYNPQTQSYGIYKIFIPNDVGLCEKQALELHQCIMASSYVEDMAKHKTILIFITLDDGTPIATCQINNNKEILQFYANETDRKNCLPSLPMKKAMNKYIKKLDLDNLYLNA